MSAVEKRATVGLAGISGLRLFGMFVILPVLALYVERLPGGASRVLLGTALGIYGLTQAALQVPFGWASDRWGRKPVVHFGLAVFAAGSVVAALATDIAWIIVGRALQGAGKDDVLLADQVYGYSTPAMGAIARGEYRSKSRDDIRGSGYVVHSLEAALWSFDTTTSYRDAILTAANLGEDADTTAAICGQVAGAFYGVNGIPAEWLARLTMRSEITDLADKLYANVEESQ